MVYDQSLILKPDFTIDNVKFAAEGVPYLTGTYIAYLITSNAGLTATLVHMLLWNWDDLKGAWSWAHPRNLTKALDPNFWMFWRNNETPEERLQRKINDPDLDPHYKLMLRNKYNEVPLWWWGAVMVISWVVGIICLYSIKVSIFIILYFVSSADIVNSRHCLVGDFCWPSASHLSSLSSSALNSVSLASVSTFNLSVKCLLDTFSPEDLLPTSTSLALPTTLPRKHNC